MQTAIKLFYRDELVELQGTYKDTALIKIKAVIVPVPLKLLRKRYANQTTRKRYTERRDEDQEDQKAQVKEG